MNVQDLVRNRIKAVVASFETALTESMDDSVKLLVESGMDQDSAVRFVRDLATDWPGEPERKTDEPHKIQDAFLGKPAQTGAVSYDELRELQLQQKQKYGKVAPAATKKPLTHLQQLVLDAGGYAEEVAPGLRARATNDVSQSAPDTKTPEQEEHVVPEKAYEARHVVDGDFVDSVYAFDIDGTSVVGLPDTSYVAMIIAESHPQKQRATVYLASYEVLLDVRSLIRSRGLTMGAVQSTPIRDGKMAAEFTAHLDGDYYTFVTVSEQGDDRFGSVQ